MSKKIIALQGKALPALSQEVQKKIEDILKPNMRVLEFGSGHSTIWFAELGCKIISIEHQPGWYQEVLKWLNERKLEASVFLRSSDTIHKVAKICPDKSIDLVFVDCLDIKRRECVCASWSKVKPGGYLVLDDSYWKFLYPLCSALDSWDREIVKGYYVRKTNKRHFYQTSFYRRPL